VPVVNMKRAVNQKAMSTPTWATSGTRVVHSTGLTGSISECKGSRVKVKFDGDPGDILIGAWLHPTITVVDTQICKLDASSEEFRKITGMV